jgi:hypothetical protein
MDGRVRTGSFPDTRQADGAGVLVLKERQHLVDSLLDWSGRLELELGLFRLQLSLIREGVLGQGESPRS